MATNNSSGIEVKDPKEALRKKSLKHWLDSLKLAIFAGAMGFALDLYLYINSEKLIDPVIAKTGLVGWYILAILPLVLYTIWKPCSVITIFDTFKYGYRHLGVLLRTILALFMLTVIRAFACYVFHIQPFEVFKALGISVAVLILYFGMLRLMIGFLIRWIEKKSNRRNESYQDPETSSEDKAQWWVSDQPIQSSKHNHFKAYEIARDRIIERLETKPDDESGLLPNIALIGGYGSGKTSLCNMVQEQYRKGTALNPGLPRALFCRYEGWQFLEPDAAVRQLIKKITQTILSEVDAPELWCVPEQYVDSLSSVLPKWLALCIHLWCRPKSPEETLSAIGSVLLRTNNRIIVFIDDLDRVEIDSVEIQKAVCRALNQIQNLPHVQYILTLGPAVKHDKNSVDILKLTRYQEHVPVLDSVEVLTETQKFRDNALSNKDFIYPWNEFENPKDDPLCFNETLNSLGRYQGITDPLAGLLSTPRCLRAVLRETHYAWEGGLKGELNWYDLLLLMALKAEAPPIYQWFIRDKHQFLDGDKMVKRIAAATNNEDIRKKRAVELQQRFIDLLDGYDEVTKQYAKDACCYLFPEFSASINSSESGGAANSEWEQRIGASLLWGPLNCDRFLSGGIVNGDVSDQGALRFIKDCNESGFDETEFNQNFQPFKDGTANRHFKKLVAFAGRLQFKAAADLCTDLFTWACEHGQLLKEVDDGIEGIVISIVKIINRCDAKNTQKEPIKGSDWNLKQSDWLKKIIGEWQDNDTQKDQSHPVAQLLVKTFNEQGLIDDDDYQDLSKKLNIDD